MAKTNQYQMTLLGRFRLEDPAGKDVTPRSAKMQAMLAMIALSPEFDRSRVWLQNRLWSDRGAAQAAASLRQDLSELRRSFSTVSSLLFVADRNSVRLSRETVQIDIFDDEGAANNTADLLEGLRVRDPAFRAWLEGQRQKRRGTTSFGSSDPAVPSASVRNSSVLLMVKDASIDGGPLATQFLDAVALGLLERTSLGVHYSENNKSSAAVALFAESLAVKGVDGLRVRLEDCMSGHAMWSQSSAVADASPSFQFDEQENLLALANEAAERLAFDFLDRWRQGTAPLDATVACQLAIGKLFTFDNALQDEADKLFDFAYKANPRGVYLAWRVMLRVIRMVELHDDAATETMEEAAEFSQAALMLEPRNSMVLAAAANAAMLINDDMIAARELADRALNANAANPFAWDCQSIWNLLAGQFERAHTMQLKAHAMSGDPRCKHWWDMGCALTATVTGRFDEARRFAENASALSPNFRPPLRYLTALYANENREEEAFNIMARLQKIETDFTVSRMVEDPKYPAAALKRSSLANRELARRLS